MNSVLTVIGNPASSLLDEALIDQARVALADAGAEPGPPDWLGPGQACDLLFAGLEPAVAETAVRTRLDPAPLDIFTQPAVGRRKRLLVADMESTIIAEEMVDEMAEILGIGAEVAAITARSMAGEIDFEASLRQRVELLRGFPVTALDTLERRITLNPGARTLVQTMRANGAYTALVTGGFACFAEPVRRLCGFHEARSNQLIVENGKLNGQPGSPILGPNAKRDALHELAVQQGLGLIETCAVGDGANDLDMVCDAGLGVAYRAKPVLRAAARVRIDHGDLTALLYLQGYRRGAFVV